MNDMLKWKLGFYMLAIDADSLSALFAVKKYADMCEEFVIGIPDEESMMRIYRNRNIDNYSEIVDLLNSIDWIRKVLILKKDQMNYMSVYDMISFDVCFVGSKFGKAYDSMFVKLLELNVSVITNITERYIYNEQNDTLSMVLDFIPRDTKIILFGTGAYFDIYMKNYADLYMPSYAIDNNKEKWGIKKDGITIFSPDELKNESENNVLVIICSKNTDGMLKQLKSIGNYDYRLMLYNNNQSIMEEFGLFMGEEDKTMDKIHSINYMMLKELVRVCDMHGIKYYLAYGSLLGAVRNGGPIPWDNDIDMLFTREEYEKLKAHRNDFAEDFFIVSPDEMGKNKYYDSVPRLLYKKAHVRLGKDICNYYNNLNNLLNIDLFLLDKTHDGLKGKIHRTQLAIIYGLMNAYRYQELVSHYGNKQRWQNTLLRIIGRLIPLAFLRKMAAKIASKYSKDPKAKYCIHSTGDLYTLNELYPAEIFETTSTVKYNDLEVSAPADPNVFLTRKYGDYMTPIDSKNRFPHWGAFRISAGMFVFDEK